MPTVETSKNLNTRVCVTFATESGQCCCLPSGVGGGSGETPSITGVVNQKILTPEACTFPAQLEAHVVMKTMPKTLLPSKDMVFDSPFGNIVCTALVLLKFPDGIWRPAPIWQDTNNNNVGVAVNCPGDGKVYVASAYQWLYAPGYANKGRMVAPLYSKGVLTEVEDWVIVLWCATNDALSTSSAVKALELRVAALESEKL